ncbi:MAG: CRTAC1 family protein [Bacteroidetes bacterium]|nr:CRTAC1 family protein [Bacteroidota bacterium]
MKTNFFPFSSFEIIPVMNASRPQSSAVVLPGLSSAWMVLGLSLALIPSAAAQMFVDGDQGHVLYTDHTGGYLGHGVSFADFNGDGFDDLSFAQHSGNLFFYQGDGTGTFTEVNVGTESTAGEPKCLLWVDLDDDGDQDLFVTQRLSPNRLYARLPNGYLSEVPYAGGMVGSDGERSYGASVADYDQDGRLDVHICHYHSPSTNTEENRLFRNLGGVDLAMQFQDVTATAGVGNGIKQSFQSTWVDVDRDGFLDLHVINDRTIWKDALYRNLGDGTFVDVASTWGMDLGVHAMSSSFADFDKDGDWDVVVSNGADLGNKFLRQLENSNTDEGESVLNFEEVSSQANILLDDLAWGALWFDANNDGWQDLFIGTGTSQYTNYPSILNTYTDNVNGFFLNNDGQFPMTNASYEVYTDNELTFASACADHNMDGALDFVSHRIGTHARLLNGVPNDNNWLSVLPVGVFCNKEAIGAVVTLWSNGLGDMRTVTCGTNYMSQSSKRLHFGLGAQSADSLVVDWPGGGKDVYTNVPTNQYVIVTQGLPLVNSTVAGCTYAVACNYNPEATQENGACDFSCLCGPGTSWDETAQICKVECARDHDGDGIIGTGDLLLFLSGFGFPCDALGLPQNTD